MNQSYSFSAEKNDMCSDQKTRPMKKITSALVRVELVDNWHARWPAVLESLAELGLLDALSIDEEGWLSARQVLLVAFTRSGVAGHLCFRLVPCATARGDVWVDAHLETFDVQPGDQSSKITSALTAAALKRAKALRCRNLVGFPA